MDLTEIQRAIFFLFSVELGLRDKNGDTYSHEERPVLCSL